MLYMNVLCDDPLFRQRFELNVKYQLYVIKYEPELIFTDKF